MYYYIYSTIIFTLLIIYLIKLEKYIIFTCFFVTCLYLLLFLENMKPFWWFGLLILSQYAVSKFCNIMQRLLDIMDKIPHKNYLFSFIIFLTLLFVYLFTILYFHPSNIRVNDRMLFFAIYSLLHFIVGSLFWITVFFAKKMNHMIIYKILILLIYHCIHFNIILLLL